MLQNSRLQMKDCHILNDVFTMLSLVSPLALPCKSRYHTETLCHADLALSSCTFFHSNSSTKGNIVMGGCQHQIHLLN